MYSKDRGRSGKYEQIRLDCLREGKLYEDRDFPANNRSLYSKNPPKVNLEWKRPGVSEMSVSYLSVCPSTDWCGIVCLSVCPSLLPLASEDANFWAGEGGGGGEGGRMSSARPNHYAKFFRLIQNCLITYAST